MMYNYFGVGSGSGMSLVWLHIHWVFVALALFGFIAAVIWLFKHCPKQQFSSLVWTSLVIGILGLLLTAPFSLRGWQSMMSFNGGYGYMSQMSEHMRQDFQQNPNWTWQDMQEHMREVHGF